MADVVTTMFVKVPFPRNFPTYAEEPPSLLLASPLPLSPGTTTPAATDEVGDPVDEDLSPIEMLEYTISMQESGAVESDGTGVTLLAPEIESSPAVVRATPRYPTRRPHHNSDAVEKRDQTATKCTPTHEPVTEDQAKRPLFRRRFASHNLEVDPPAGPG